MESRCVWELLFAWCCRGWCHDGFPHNNMGNHISSRNPSWQNCPLYLLKRQLFESDILRPPLRSQSIFFFLIVRGAWLLKWTTIFSKSLRSAVWWNNKRLLYVSLLWLYYHRDMSVFQQKKKCPERQSYIGQEWIWKISTT